MKQTQYDITYLNGNKQTFYCSGVHEAYCAACYFADSKGWDSSIEKMTNEYGEVYTDFTFQYRKINNYDNISK